MRSLFKFFIDRPLVVKLLLLLLIILLGAVFSQLIKREGLPKVDMREVYITTIYPGASPEDVELNVTIPIEDELKTVTGIKEMSSTSMENLSRIIIKLDPDVPDLEKVKQDIRRAVDTARDLPREIKDRPVIWEMKVQNFAVIEVAFSSATLADRELIARAKAFKKQLERLELVSRVDSVGIRDREVQIKIDLDKLNMNFLSFDDVVAAIQSRNINLAGGNLESYVDEKGIITVSRFENLGEVEDIILRSNFEGNQIRLRDVARVIDTFERRTSYIRYNGADGVSLQVVKKENADIIRTIDQIKALVSAYQASPAGRDVQLHFLNDMSSETRSRLSMVVSNAVIGLVLVVLILFLFLNRKIAFWTALGIPVSILIALVGMFIMGITINTISLSAIIIVLGMLVDDAIVISENIFRYRKSGLTWKDAALVGVHEVARPVTATVTTTAIAFVPILFMSGSVADFARDIPVVIALALFASLLESFFMLPQHLSHVREQKPARAGRTQDEESRFAGAFFGFVDRIYQPLLRTGLRRRYLLLLLFVVFLAGSVVYMMTSMKFLMFDPDQSILFWLDGQTRRGSSLEKTSNDIRRIEEMIKMFKKGSIPAVIDKRTFENFICDNLQDPGDVALLRKSYRPGKDGLYQLLPDSDTGAIEQALIKSGVKINIVESFKSQIGLSIWGNSEDPNFFNIIVYLTPANTRSMRAADLIALLRQRISALPQVEKCFFVVDSGGPPVGRELEIKLTGHDDARRLAALGYLQGLFAPPVQFPAAEFNRVLAKVADGEDTGLLRAAYRDTGGVRVLKQDLTGDLCGGRLHSRVLPAIADPAGRQRVERAFRRGVPDAIPAISFRSRILAQLKDARSRELLLQAYRHDAAAKAWVFRGASAEDRAAEVCRILKTTGYSFPECHVLRTALPRAERDAVIDILHQAGYATAEELARVRVILDRAGVMLNGIYDIDQDYEAGKDELRIRLDYRRIARYGLTAVQVAQAIRTAYNGTVVTWLQTQEERIEYRILLDDRYRMGRQTLDAIRVGNREGRLVPLTSLLSIEDRKSVKRIHHDDRDRSITLSANIDKNLTEPLRVFSRLKQMVPQVEKRFPGVLMLIKGEAEESAKTYGSLMVAFLVAIVGVYFLLVLLFGSFTQPFMVLLAIPFGMVGVIIAFGLHGLNLSMMAMLGVIGLSGVVVNDALVMIDFINRDRQKEPGKPLVEVIVDGARLRVRAIFLTSVTTCAGLFPTAYGIGGYDSQIAPMTLALAWGLVFSTVLTLLLIPALYLIEEDVKHFVMRLRDRLLRRV